MLKSCFRFNLNLELAFRNKDLAITAGSNFGLNSSLPLPSFPSLLPSLPLILTLDVETLRCSQGREWPEQADHGAR